VQINYYYGEAARTGPVIVGHIPRAAVAYRARKDLSAQLRASESGASAVRVVTGMPGVGKSQLAAAYARECVADRWRLVAWVNAEDTDRALASLAEVADRLGISRVADSVGVAGERVRQWLESDANDCLVVFDNVGHPEELRPYLPAKGRSRVILTGSGMQEIGSAIHVGTFTPEEALAFLAERAGVDAGAPELARALGYLPLALAQAAAVIAARRLSVQDYLAQLHAISLWDRLPPVQAEPYPYALAETILLGTDTVAATDESGVSRDVLDLVAMLSPAGIARGALLQASYEEELAQTGGPRRVDEALGLLESASLASFSDVNTDTEDTVLVHPLVARVARERNAHAGTLADVAVKACALLEVAMRPIEDEPLRNRSAAHDAVANILALDKHIPPEARGDGALAVRMLGLRSWALWCLLTLDDDISQAVQVGEQLIVDSDQLLGEDHPHSLALRTQLATAYHLTGRLDEATRMFEQALSGQERVLGADHPETAAARNSLALAYQDSGRLGEATRLFQQAAADRERILGADHLDTLRSRNNLAAAYRLAGRPADAIPLFAQTLAAREMYLGPDHPDTLASRNNLAGAYQDAGRLAEATPLYERALADQSRLLGVDHPDTLVSMNNLALAYRAEGRVTKAVPLLERALAGLERVLGEENPQTLLVRRNLADARSEAGSPARVLIVSSREPDEEDVATGLARALSSRHLQVIDANAEIRVGQRVGQGLQQVVRSADVVLVVVTEHGLGPGSAWSDLERTEGALDSESVLIPVFVGRAASSIRLPYDLARRQGITIRGSSDHDYDLAAEQVAGTIAARRQARSSVASLPGRTGGRLAREDLDETVELVLEAFRAAGRPLRPGGEPQLFEPGPVWISAELIPSREELDIFAMTLHGGRSGYFVHTGDLPRNVSALVDHMRVSGKKVVTVSVRALQAALAAGEARMFLEELEQFYGSKDNLFDTKNALIDDRFLFGRDAMLTRIGSAISRDEHVLVSGLRKVGKTSLLNILRQHLVGYPVCQVDLQRFDRHTEEWPPELFAAIVDAVDRWGRIGRVDWPFEPASPATATQLGQEIDRRFTHLGTESAKRRVVVMLDEIERVFPRAGEAEAARRWLRAAGALRALAQGSTRSVVVIGADLRPVANRANELGNGETNPFYNFFQEIPVTLLDHQATGDMIESLARAMGISTVTKEFVDEISALTGGHPSLARAIAAEAYRERAGQWRLDESDLNNGLAALHDTDSVGSFLRSNLWEPMTAGEKKILAELSRHWAPSKIESWRRSDVAFAEGYATLRSQGIIGDEGIRIGLLRDWVRYHSEAGVE
jgi:tetratricopeptide (TPR) repeat protein